MSITKPSEQHRAQALANLHGLIICSNSAAHLWPLSREHAPLELMVDVSSGLSLLAKAIMALAPYCERPLFIATPLEIAPLIEAHIRDQGLLEPHEYQLLVEPHPRGSALTVALASATMKLADPHTILVCLPANVAFDADSRWEQALKKCHAAAQADKIALIGSSVPPQNRPPHEQNRSSWELGHPALDAQQHNDKSVPMLGSIHLGLESKEIEGVFAVRGFIARPAPPVAWRAQQSKSPWSTHIFMLKADLALAEMRGAEQRFDEAPKRAVGRIAETARFFVSLGDSHWNSTDALRLVDTLPDLSFEEAVCESSAHLVAVPTSIEFWDLTSLEGYARFFAADTKNNRLQGNILAVDTSNTTVISDSDKLVVTLGLADAMVIDTPDATLIASKQALASMPGVIAALRAANAPEL